MQNVATMAMLTRAVELPGHYRTKTLIRVMRLTAYILLLGTLHLSAAIKSQTISFSGKDVPIQSIFEEIKKQTGYFVVSSKQVIAKASPVTIHAENVALTDFLNRIMSGQPLHYTIKGKNILLSLKKDVAISPGFFSETIINNPPSVAISGVIRSDNGEPLSGVSVRLKRTDIGTTTDGYGGFQINRVQENAIIELSIIGYEQVEFTLIKAGDFFNIRPSQKVDFTVDNLSNPGLIYITVNLKKSLSILDETQVIAYGKTSRRYSTGSVGTVKGEEIQKQPVMNVLQALEGRVAGLVLTPQSGNSAAPIKVEIRGRNAINPNSLSEPLYVIDGIPQGALNISVFANPGVNSGPVQAGRTNTSGESPLLFLNPRDIESIDVLKDADATAIYGARGANGVILITTKRSKPGPTKFNMNVARGKTTIPRKLNLMNTGEYLAVRREALRNDGITPDIYNAPDLMLWDQNAYTDWQDYFFTPGEQLTVDAGVSGGIAQTSYNLTASYQSQEELMNQGGKTSRGSFAGTIMHTSLNQKFQVNFSSRLSITNVDAIPAGEYISTPPNAPDIFTEKGDFNFVPYRGLFSSNFPFKGLKLSSESKTNTISNSVRLSYEIIKGLTLSANAGYNFTSNNNAYFTPAAAADPLFGNLSQAYYGNSTTKNWLVEPQLQYNTFVGGKGNLSVQLGGSLQDIQNEGLTTLSAGFPNDNLLRSPNNAAFSQVIEGSGQYRYIAAFAIVNYRWDNKYVINLNGRRDGSSRFGPGKQFGNFGSIGLAWIASEEKWLKAILPSWWTFAKLRGSYGVAGSDGVSDYEYLTRWSNSLTQGSPTAYYDYNGTTAFSLMHAVNPDFRWGSTIKTEVGATFGFLRDKINIEALYYSNKSGNQLTSVNTPDYTGFGSVTANWDAVVQNQGVEVSINGRLLDTKNWHVSANFNIGKNTNRLIDYPGLEYSAYADQYAIGHSLDSRYLFHYVGINPATGDYVLEDYNKDGQVSYFSSVIPKSPQDDRYIVYDLNPDYTGGFGAQAAFKEFALSAQFIFKKRLAPNPYYDLSVGRMQNLYVPKEITDNHWKQPGDIAQYPKYTSTGLNSAFRSSDGYYTDASYLKLSTISLSYDLPSALLKKIKIQSCRLSINTQNLFTITSYRGIDPEINSFTAGTPVTRTIATNLMFTF